MHTLFEIKDTDRNFYKAHIADFLPDKIIDIHTHVWLEKFKKSEYIDSARTVTWPSLVAKDNSIENLFETYDLMFPGKEVTPLIFSNIGPSDDIESANEYITDCSVRATVPSLLFACPWWSAEQLQSKIFKGGFVGIKVYLNFSPASIPENAITIFDFLPHHQLETIDRLGLIVMLHIPRKDRFKDVVNQQQLLEIHAKYKNLKLIIAHVGRAYCNHDVGNTFEVLKKADRFFYDFSANTNSWVFEQLIKAVGSKRILFGSDMPITRMRMRRIEKNGIYVNVVPKGMYGDVSGDKNMEELEYPQAEQLTFFMYEEINAFRMAAETASLKRKDIEDIFFNNAAKLIRSTIPNKKFRFD